MQGNNLSSEKHNLFNKIGLVAKEHYIIFPIICLCIYALLNNLHGFNAYDFSTFYYVGRYIFTNPELIYTNVVSPMYYYLPSFAMVMSPLSLVDITSAKYIFLFISIFLGILMLYECNQILLLKKIDNIYFRLLILLVLSNGYIILRTFEMSQPKYLSGFLIFLFLKREIKIRDLNMDQLPIKFLFIQFSILIFIFGMIPSIGIFIIVLYLFNNIYWKEIFSAYQIKKFILIIIVFLYQNFIFIINPEVLLNFISGTDRVDITMETNLMVIIIQYFPIDLPSYIFLLKIISIIIMTIITIILVNNKKYIIEEKIALLALFSFLFNIFIRINIFLILIPLIAILFFVNIEKKHQNILTYLKNNSQLFLGLLCLSLLSFIPETGNLYKYFPYLRNINENIINLKYGIVIIILTIDIVLFLKIREEKYISGSIIV